MQQKFKNKEDQKKIKNIFQMEIKVVPQIKKIGNHKGKTLAARKFFRTPLNILTPLSPPRLLAHDMSNPSPLSRSSLQIIPANKVVVYV